MPFWLVGVLGAAAGVGVYELVIRPLVAPSLGLNPAAPPPQPVAAAAPPGPAFPGALGHLTPVARSAGAMGTEALAQATIAQARGRR